jgi:hypothetical protein
MSAKFRRLQQLRVDLLGLLADINQINIDSESLGIDGRVELHGDIATRTEIFLRLRIEELEEATSVR